MKDGLDFMVFNATFNNISVLSWRSVLLVEKTRVPGENYLPVASHWQLHHIRLYRVHLMYNEWTIFFHRGGHRGRDRMVVGFTDNYLCNQCLSPLALWVWILFKARCTRYNLMWWSCQWLATGRWFSPGTLVFSTNKTDLHDRTEILLKVALKTIKSKP
jgi:hypothetical protein